MTDPCHCGKESEYGVHTFRQGRLVSARVCSDHLAAPENPEPMTEEKEDAIHSPS